MYIFFVLTAILRRRLTYYMQVCIFYFKYQSIARKLQAAQLFLWQFKEIFMNKNSKTLILVEAAMCIALATILSYLKIYEMPFGGSITLEMLPIVFYALRRGYKWGVVTGFAHGVLQMILGFSSVLYCSTLLSQIGCILLDYVIAFSVLGLASVFAAPFKHSNRKIGYIVGAVIVGILRFICSFLSGWLLWSSYAPEGMHPAFYSLVYNGAYMFPDILILAIVIGILSLTIPKLFYVEEKENYNNDNIIRK